MLNPLLAVAAVTFLAACHPGQHEGPGTPTPQPAPAADVEARQRSTTRAVTALVPETAADTRPTKQILFGDLHVHTTFSTDAFLMSLPMLQGEGAHPPADACDFARFCSQLDFWSLNDHAEGLTPQHWREMKEAIRQCNTATDPRNPDTVAFLGWEWTQVGTTAASHYGHKNVILKETDEDKVPARPISALDANLVGGLRQRPPLWQQLYFPFFDWTNRQRYFDFGTYQEELRDIAICPDGVDSRTLPDDCSEVALTPQALFEKLAQWGGESLVIPHGTTWGFYTPPGSSWDKQLTAAQHDPTRQRLIEVFSGHGNSEEWKGFDDVATDAEGNMTCPEPTKDYVPCCWHAGEIIRSRCGDIPAEQCEQRVAAARRNYIGAEAAGRVTVPGTTAEDWKDCGYCRTCFQPAFNYRPKSSAQYIMTLANPDGDGPRDFTFGFIASSDNHKARPGTGYKEYKRRMMTEATGARDDGWRTALTRLQLEEPPDPESRRIDPKNPPEGIQQFMLLDQERQASFFLTGGLVAVHAAQRSRDGIWDALQRREVYGTSGPRMLLWFDLLNGPRGPVPMGGEATLNAPPLFRARAVGSFAQKPGCPAWPGEALGPERLELLCRGECYHPSDERRRITRIEIVRIRRRLQRNEPTAPLIDDPWRRFECPNDPNGCEVQFQDPDFPTGGRDVVYYARAIEAPSQAVNAGAFRCTYDAAGICTSVSPCHGDSRTPYEDDCLAPTEERAWSSPIFLRPGS
jgi:Protein of unknown function (DUF3604)